MAKGKPKRKPFGMNSSLADATQVMRQLPVSAMLSSIEMQINILQERGVEIRDWENKDRVGHWISWVLYFTEPRR